MGEPAWAATVRLLRISAELTQGELAEKAGVRPNTLSEAVNGHTSPNLETLEKVAGALNVPLWRLFVDERQAQILAKQEQADAAVTKIAELQERVERTVLERLSALVKEATAEHLESPASSQVASRPAKPLAAPRPALAPKPPPKTQRKTRKRKIA